MRVLDLLFSPGVRLSFRRLVCCAALTATPISGARAQSPRIPDLAMLRPGDLVRVSVWRKPEMSGDYILAADSTIKHPLYREIRLAGLSVREARERLVVFLRDFENSPQVSIEPLFRVSVFGEVQNPSLYTMPPETSIAQAVAMAGGVTERGRMDHVRLLRDGRESVVDLNSAITDAIKTPIASGDQIIVARRSRIFRDYALPILTSVGSIAAVINVFYRR